MRAVLVLGCLAGCASMPETPQVWIPSADADWRVDIDRGVQVRVEDLHDDMAARAVTPAVQLPPACDAALRHRGPLGDCVSGSR